MHLLPTDEYADDLMYVFQPNNAGEEVKSYTSTVLEVHADDTTNFNTFMDEDIALATDAFVLVHMCYNSCYLIEMLVQRH